MDIQDISNEIHGGNLITPVKHKSDETSHNDNSKHDTTNDKSRHQFNDKVSHNKHKTKINVSSGMEMEGDFLASLDEVLKTNQADIPTQGENNSYQNNSYQNNDKLSSNDDLKHDDNHNDDKNTLKKLDNQENNTSKRNNDTTLDSKKANPNGKSDDSQFDTKNKTAMNGIDLKKVKEQVDAQQGHETKKSAGDENVLKSLKETQQQGIASKLDKGQHVKVEVKQTHQNKSQGQSFKVKVASKQALNPNADHTKLHKKIVEANEEKIGASASANVSNNNINANLVGGGVSNTGLNNSTIGKVSADAVTGVKGSTGKSNAGTQNMLGGLNSQKSNLATNNKSRPLQQSRPVRKHVHIASTVNKVNVDIAKAVEGGADRININLRPNNMGRIDVQIDMQQKGAVVIVNVEKQETLELLQADASSLQQALEGTGMELQGEMQFNLQENTSGGYDQGHQHNHPQDSEEEDDSLVNGVPTLEALQEVRSANAESRGGVDLVL